MSAGLANIGTMALEHGGRVDFARLRRQRRDRCLAAMEADGLDVLVLGREANAKYVSGARRLWTAGSRPFGPGCVVVRATGQVHLVNTWHDGIPDDIPPENLQGISWNPMTFVSWMKSIDGFADARRVGVDGMSTSFAPLLPLAAPNAEAVDATATMFGARRLKTPDEIECIRVAVAIAESSLLAAVDGLRPGVAERELLGRFEERMCTLGVTTPAMEGTFCATPRHVGVGNVTLRQLTGSATVNEGDLVAMSSGVLYAGYEGAVGRTWPCLSASSSVSGAQRDLYERWTELWGGLRRVIRSGADAGTIREAYLESGEPLPPVPIAHGIGLGMEPPFVGLGLSPATESAWSLEAGMVLAVQGYVWREGTGGYLAKEIVVVTDTGHDVLTTLGPGPLGVR